MRVNPFSRCGLWVALLLVGFLARPAMSRDAVPSAEGSFVPGEILVKLKSGASAAGISALGSARGAPSRGLVLLSLPGSERVEDAVERASRQPDVEWAQPNYRFHALQCAGPSDPYVATDQAWALQQIHAYGGWARFASCPPVSSPITVAVLDTGVDATHPDLTGSVLPGWDVFQQTVLPTGVSGDDNGHGTFVAGLIGAVWNGGGMAGLAGNARILPVKVLDADGNGTSHTIMTGIQAAVVRGARVINLSLGGIYFGTGDKAIVDAARAEGVVVVAAAGNHDPGVAGSVSEVNFPAAYPPVLAVGATDAMGGIAYYSNFGVSLDLMAPGGGNPAGFDSALEMFSTVWSGASSTRYPRKNNPPDAFYGSGSGTSFAAPMVSAAAALVMARFPGLTASQVEDRLGSTADEKGDPGWDKRWGYGLLNVERALAEPYDASGYYAFLRTFNSPNPFRLDIEGTTNITLALDRPQSVELAIYDASGETVLKRVYAPSELNSGGTRPQFKSYYVSWDGTNGRGRKVVTGVYFYEVKSGGAVGNNKIAVIRGF